MTATHRSIDERLLRRVAEVSATMADFYLPEQVSEWLFAEQPMLGYKRPVDLMQTEEGWTALRAEIARLCDSSFA